MSVLEAVTRMNQIAALLSAPAPPAAPAAQSAAPAQAGFGAALDQAMATDTGAPAVPYGAEIRTAADRNGVDPALLAALVQHESGFDAGATSPAGAVGLTQLMPSTAQSLGVDPTDPAQSLDGGARYLRQQLDRFGGDPALALAAYNAGPNAVERSGGVPPYAETRHYVASVLDTYKELRP